MLYNMAYPQDQRGASLPAARATARPKQRSQSQYPGRLDPQDLTRRLNVVLAEQKARSERRRRAKAEAVRTAADGGIAATAAVAPARPETQPDAAMPHRSTDDTAHEEAYVPQNAAAQFERTTTTTKTTAADSKTHQGNVHRLSRRAMKSHLADVTTLIEPGATTAETARALKKAQHEREKVLDRNQFQRDRRLEEAAEADQERELRNRQLQMRSIEARLSGARFSEDNDETAPRLSGSDFLKKLESRESAADGRECAELPHDVNEHRVDWTQSDERDDARTKDKGAAPRLRKPESIWTLKGRLTRHRDGRPEKTGSRSSEDAPASAEKPKSPINQFFARLKVSH
ncbi:hypothetical protein F5X68DRAFT_79190 [Plectosphaerella plurivora]|uniref:Uncharacterized protein n=1 Tax=Plectosphaerella plurivora TaxID=936078 RepID=A0A9P9ADE2_9PEZI|nr:hypothetical protein F5X68DRAFT_79190 [Plectosphaerella plurivora]